MYNQGNYQQFGQRLPTLPPPPPPPFQQGTPAPQHPSIPPPYGHASPGSMQLRPPVSVPLSGMLSSSQSYLIPPPPPPLHVHGSTSTLHTYSTGPQSSNWSQNQHHILPPVPPPGHHLTPRIPPPHPQGQQFFRIPAPPLLPGGIGGIQQVLPPLPPPPTSSFFMPAPFGSFAQPIHESSMGHLPPSSPPPPPPPPPSSPPPGPPPLPPSSPPPNSPLHPSSESTSTAVKLGPNSADPSDVVDVVASDVIYRSSDDCHRSNDTLGHDNNLNDTGVNGTKMSMKDTSDPNTTTDIPPPPPPPRPRDEKTVQKIEVLCQYIAKNGDEFEEMTRQKEAGNSEFEFLFGGVPGSEAAISHEYFKWMKKKCSSSELLEGRQNSDISLGPSRASSSLQPDDSMHADISHSPAGSDMEMEDDITQPDEPHTSKSFGSASHEPAFISNEVANHEPASISNEVDVTLEEHACDLEHISPKDAKDGNLFCSGSSGVVEQGADPPQDLHQEMNPLGASSEFPGELIKGTSPFRLLQDYASDDSSENDNDPHLEDVSPETTSPQVQTGTADVDTSELYKGLGTLSASKLPEPSSNQEDCDNKEDSGSQTFVAGGPSSPKNGRLQKEDGDTKLEVDEFGRMVKAGASDSDSEDDYMRRRRKRGRSRTRSRSPYERRRRSPWRRREKRSRSHSWSPRKRSRSRSPYRHGGAAGGAWTRPDRNHLPVCNDFRRGKCFRGALCRYIHDSDKTEESGRHKNKQQYEKLPNLQKSSDKSLPENNNADIQEMQFVEPADYNADEKKSPGGDNSGDRQSQANLSGQLPQNPDNPLQQNVQTSAIPAGVHLLNQMSPAKPPSLPPPPPPLSQGLHALIPPPPPREYYPSQLPVPPAATWNPLPLPLPPPPPRPQLGALLSQYQQIPPPPQLNYPQPIESHLGVYPPPLEPPRPPPHTEDFRLGPGSMTFGEENFPRPQSQSLLSREPPPAGRLQSFSGENLPPSGHPYIPQYNLQNPGEPANINLRYPTDFSDGVQLPGLSDFRRSRISTHYNPYASTFDQPLSTKFSSGVLTHNIYGSSATNTPPGPTRYLTRSGGDQYDPLFDSFEPAKILDVEENTKHKAAAVAIAAAAAATTAASVSVENDEFGETADAEVGAVENDSPSSPINLPDMAAGEVEIDQVKNHPGKTKSKDSRSMKLFKIALAEFVKEVLKPSWRQGNMSKEAFKTIVKKTVDKVSGAMKKHQIPKSQAKINQYIDSSQRKLTKLVMGYVDKYVKV